MIKAAGFSLLSFYLCLGQHGPVPCPRAFVADKNSRSVGTMKTKMIAWVTGIILLIILLMTVIVSMEQPGEGISRAQASKALALALTDKEECESRAKERQSSWFSAKEKDNWFVMYMDYLYEEGYFDPQLTEASLKEGAYLSGGGDCGRKNIRPLKIQGGNDKI